MNRKMKNSFGLREIGQIAVPVTDLDRAVVFYRDVLGMTLLFQVSPGLAFFDCGSVRLLLDSAVETSKDTYGSIVYYKVDKIQDAYEILLTRGVIFTRPPEVVAHTTHHDLWMAFFHDPDDNLLALMSKEEPLV